MACYFNRKRKPTTTAKTLWPALAGQISH